MMHREDILQQALALPPEDRAFVAAALEESLSAAECGTELLAELDRRSAAFHSGKSTARTAADVLHDQRQRQAGEANA